MSQKYVVRSRDWPMKEANKLDINSKALCDRIAQ
jgi:hypothetical protein